MGVFTRQLKSFESDITGEVKEYKINTAIYLFLESEFDIKPSNMLEVSQIEQHLYNAKFATAVLKANGVDVTYNEVLENTDEVDLQKFSMAFNGAINGKVSEELEKMKDESKVEKK